MESEYIPAKDLSELSRKANLYALIGRVYKVLAFETDSSGNARIAYERGEHSPHAGILDFLNFHFRGKGINSNVKLDLDRSIGINFALKEDFVSEVVYLRDIIKLQTYGNEHYNNKYQIILANNQIVFLLQLNDHDYKYIREEYFVTKLDGTDIGEVLRKSVKNNVPLITSAPQ